MPTHRFFVLIDVDPDKLLTCLLRFCTMTSCLDMVWLAERAPGPLARLVVSSPEALPWASAQRPARTDARVPQQHQNLHPTSAQRQFTNEPD